MSDWKLSFRYLTHPLDFNPRPLYSQLSALPLSHCASDIEEQFILISAYNAGLRSLQSDIGSSNIKLSPISLTRISECPPMLETAIVDYLLFLANKANKLLFSVSVCSKQTEVYHFCFPIAANKQKLPFSASSALPIYIYTENGTNGNGKLPYIYIYIHT